MYCRNGSSTRVRGKGGKGFWRFDFGHSLGKKVVEGEEEHLKPYQQYLEDLIKIFDKIEYTSILRAQNQFADALATLASMVEILEGVWT